MSSGAASGNIFDIDTLVEDISVKSEAEVFLGTGDGESLRSAGREGIQSKVGVGDRRFSGIGGKRITLLVTL